MNTRRATDRAVSIVAAVAAPVITLLVDQQVLSTQAGVDVAAIVAAAVASWHGSAAVTRRQRPAEVPPPDPGGPRFHAPELLGDPPQVPDPDA